MDDDATQPSTQAVFDPRRAGHNTSGLNEADAADVLCILHPCSQAALAIVSETYKRSPQHVLQSRNNAFVDDSQLDSPSEQETFILDEHNAPLDLALRLSSHTMKPALGFTFGRNPLNSDIVLHVDSMRRISNLHFRIYVNDSGVLMIEDTSTNGTLVDDVHLRKRGIGRQTTRMLQANSIIQILSPVQEDCIKFLVRIPPRDEQSHPFIENFQRFMTRVKLAEQEAEAKHAGGERAVADAHDKPHRVSKEQAALQAASSIKPALARSQYGMKWDGGNDYNVVGHLGKGAFANVYKLATNTDGKFFAAKELEKRRFMKRGVLDKRIQNEMEIMQTVRHPNIVQYVNYHDVNNHLYIIMEFVPCGDLQGYLQDHGELTEDQGQVMSRQVLGALAYLHDQKITHRDIKPDNILLSREDPFEVKLSDFGLSKVVHNNDTFLKTFCGTLLYCAPEVFPHYSNHATVMDRKRRRGARPQAEAHSYSQSVDTWSYAAVLWFSLCNQPPFEGVADQTGLAMFNKIMETRLDISPLKFKGISDAGIDLLVKMLNTDPSQRPSERQCLTHPWLADGSVLPPELEAGLGAIEEEDEGEQAGPAPDMSQLSIRDQVRHFEVPEAEESEFGFGSHDLDDFLDPRQSKRARDDLYAFREKPDLDSSPEVSLNSEGILRESSSHNAPTSSDPANGPRLFGEIGHSALQNSNALDVRTNVALALSREEGSTTDNSDINEPSHAVNDRTQEAMENELWLPSGLQSRNGQEGMRKFKVGGAGSLLGAESLVRDLHMESPPSANSPAAGEPSTPKTPEHYSHSTTPNHTKSPHTEEITPRPPPFNRQISIPFSASFFDNQQNLDANVFEETRQADDHSFGSSLHLATHASSFPRIMDSFGDSAAADRESTSSNKSGSPAGQPNDPNTDSTPKAQRPPTTGIPPPTSTLPTSPPSTAFARPPPRLGKLTTTPTSFTQLTLPLSTRLTTWGRDPANTHIYPDRGDTRIPKRGILLWFHAKGVEGALAADPHHDWVKMEGLHTIVSTESRVGIWVNGVHLKRGTGETGTLYGRVYSGDEIVVVPPGKVGGVGGVGGVEATTTTTTTTTTTVPKEGLVFVCEFFHGEAAGKRPEGGPRFEVLQEIR